MTQTTLIANGTIVPAEGEFAGDVLIDVREDRRGRQDHRAGGDDGRRCGRLQRGRQPAGHRRMQVNLAALGRPHRRGDLVGLGVLAGA
jgi:hypothetical protein